MGRRFWGIQTVSDCHLRKNPFLGRFGVRHLGSCGWSSYPSPTMGLSEAAMAPALMVSRVFIESIEQADMPVTAMAGPSARSVVFMLKLRGSVGECPTGRLPPYIRNPDACGCMGTPPYRASEKGSENSSPDATQQRGAFQTEMFSDPFFPAYETASDSLLASAVHCSIRFFTMLLFASFLRTGECDCHFIRIISDPALSNEDLYGRAS